MTVQFYRNTDVDAPVLRGNTPGDLLNLLTKCLVDGYGSQPAAGWSKPYTGTNIAAFKTGPGGNDMYLRVDDTATNTSRRPARVVGYESMSGISTGTGPFPSAAQVSGGGYWFTQYQTATGVNSARTWTVVADELFFWIIIDTAPDYGSNTNFYYSECYYFGDIIGYGAADAFSSLLSCGITATDDTNNSYNQPLSMSNTLTTNNSRVFAPRRWDQLGGAVNQNLHSDGARGSTYLGLSGISYPNGPDGRLYMSPVWVGDGNVSSNVSVRGQLPGLWNPLHPIPFGRGDTFEGNNDLAGKEFYTWRQSGSCWAIETNGDWRA